MTERGMDQAWIEQNRAENERRADGLLTVDKVFASIFGSVLERNRIARAAKAPDDRL